MTFGTRELERRQNKPPSAHSRENELLLLCTRPALDDARLQRFQTTVTEGVDWAYLLLGAHRLGVLPMLHRRIAGLDSVPSHVREQLAVVYETNHRRTSAAASEMLRVSTRLRLAGIETTTLRLPSVGRYYDSQADRQFEPIEMLVPAQAAAPARDLLLGEGYRRVHPLDSRQEAVLLRSRALPLHNDESDVRLHLHAKALPSYVSGRRFDSSSRPGAGEGSVLSAEELLVQVCLHGSVQMWGRLAWLGDVAGIVESEQLDWDAILDSLTTRSARRMFLLGLKLAADLLDVALPLRVVALIAADARLRALADQLEWAFWHDARGHTAAIERLVYRARMMSSALEKASFLLRFVLDPDVEDVKVKSLPPALSHAYVPLRLWRIGCSLGARAIGRVRPAPYFPTPLPLVEHMLRMADVGPGDVVYDLGCGDGRAVIEAAKLGAFGVGVDLSGDRIAESRSNAIAAGVSDRVRFEQGDATKTTLSDATVVFLWLLPSLNLYMRPRLQATLPLGARIVSHAFDMGDWIPDRADLVQISDDNVAISYLWTIRDSRPEAIREQPKADESAVL